MSQANAGSPVREGDVIASKYRVERILGIGGMGVVVAAKHLELGELFALKFLLPTVRDNKEVCTRFAREARTGIRIKNEHVARVFDVGTLPDGAPYMVMEHLTGEDVAALIARRGPLPVEEAVDLLLQACEAICEAHQIGVVHRDLKPANLFVTTGSDGLPFVKVLDFGISKSVEGVEDLSVTATSAVLGSPLYMSPEQLTSSRSVDRRSDLWSLGVILYEMLTGQTPFAGETFPTLCAAILGGKYMAMSMRQPTLPTQLDEVVAATLTLDRDARLASIRDLSSRLAPFGSPHAQTSDVRISRITARSAPPAINSSPDATLPPELAATEDAGASGEVLADDAMRPRDTGLGLSTSNAGRRRDRSRASMVIAAGVLATAALGLAAWMGHRTTQGTDEVAAAPPEPRKLTAAATVSATVDPLPAIELHDAGRPTPQATTESQVVPKVTSGVAAKPPHRDPHATPATASSSTPHPPRPSTDTLFDSQK